MVPTTSSPGNRLFGRTGGTFFWACCFMNEINKREKSIIYPSSLGNALATSGLRTTILEDSFNRFAYLPRIRPPGKSERLYSARNSSLSGFLSFFIEFFFSFARFAGTYNSNCLISLGVRHHYKPAFFETPKVIYRSSVNE